MGDRRRPGLNADLGEGFPHDVELLRHLDCASIACGGHAGSASTMQRAVRAAVRAGVRIGAHVSYPDRRHFGRISVLLPVRRLEASLLAQARALLRVARRSGVPLDHLKPHGALYHDADRHRRIAAAVGRVIRRLGGDLTWVGTPGGWQQRTARRLRIGFVREGFADRRYGADGRLVPRTAAGAVLRDAVRVGRQAGRLARSGRYDTLCLHSDTPGCARLAAAARRALRR